MNKHSSCIICNSKKIVPISGYEKAHLCCCEDCNFVFSQKIPSSQELDNYYKNYGVNQYLSPLTIKRYNELLDEFEAYRSTNKLLDIGCGIGYFLDEAKKRGWEVYGTEISEKQADMCNNKGIKTIKGVLKSEDFNQEMFDVITSFEVIEHINNPRHELNTISAIIRKGGLVYVTTPNFNSLLRYKLKSTYNIINYPEHLSYYTPNTLQKVFENSGFKSLKVATTGVSLTRFRTSKGTSDQKLISAKSDDEKIRNQIDSKWYLKVTKAAINFILTLTGTGDSVKGWFVKT